MQNFVVVSHTVRAHVEGPKIWGSWWCVPSDVGVAVP